MENENLNFFSILRLFCEATKLIRSHFLKVWKQKKRSEWTNDEESGKFFLSSDGLTIKQKVRQNQLTILLSGNINAWDLSLLGLIFSNKPFNNDSKSYFIRNIRDQRNQVFHTPSFTISDEEFKTLWHEISNAMLELGYSKSDLSMLKNLDEKKVTTNISNENTAKIIKEEANEELKKQNFEKAIELYSSAIPILNLSDQDYSILYSNRSLAYLKVYLASTNKLDQRNLMRALNDAQMAADLNPKWYKAYYRLGQIYKEFNNLVKSQENFKIALLLQPNDEELKNALAQVKYLYFEQLRSAHFDEQCAPRTTEEHFQRMIEKNIEPIYGNNKSDFIERIDKIVEISKKEDPALADVWLAHEYRDGSKNFKQNYELAAKYYGKAASLGNPEAIYNLGLLNEKGLGVMKDFKTAFNLFKQAAQKNPTRKLAGLEISNVGVAEAEHSLGIFYAEGIYVDKNISTAISWYQRAIEHGHNGAANNLGLIYGFSEPCDFEKAERMFILAHKRDDNNAIPNIVDLYLRNNQPDNALLWHERALKNNSLFDSCRDDEVREKINFLKDNYSTIQEKQTNINNNILMDPNRVNLIKWHRNSISEFLKLEESFQNQFKNTFKPPKIQCSVNSISNLKEINLKEIDFTKDHVLEGHKLKITIFDIPFKSSYSIFFLVEDENKFMERMAVYNLGDDFESIKKLYPVGSRFFIMNPYIRMAADSKPMIRIDDPKSIISLESVVHKMCRYCGKQDSKFNCSKCLNSFYCSKDCQLNDWNLLDHKLICFQKK